MRREQHRREHRDGHRVPVEDPDPAPHAEVGEERHRELAAPVERHPPDHVAERGAKQHGQQQAGHGKDEVPPRSPEPVAEVAADLDGHAAKDERPEHEPEREVEPGERGRHDSGEGEQERAAERQEPHLVPAPERSERGDDFAALEGGLRRDRVQSTRADVPAVEHGKQRQREAEKPEPQFSHAPPPWRRVQDRARSRARRDTDTAGRGRSRAPPSRSA